MKILISSKKFAEQNKTTRPVSIGTYYSADRYYTLMNTYMDENLKKRSKFLFFITTYLFQSSNYKHQTTIANGKTKAMIFTDIFAWICMFLFIGCFIAGVGAPVITFLGDKDIQTLLRSFLTTGLPLLVISLITGIVTAIYLTMFFKIMKKNRTLALKDYVLKKMEFILKWKFFLHADKIKNKISKQEEQELITLEKSETLGGDADRWLFLQMNNVLCMLFPNFNLTAEIDGLDEEYVSKLEQIIEHDFAKICLTVISEKQIQASKKEKTKKKNILSKIKVNKKTKNK